MNKLEVIKACITLMEYAITNNALVQILILTHLKD